MYAEEIKGARERAASLVTISQGFAKEMREKPEQAKEVEEKFNKSYSDFVSAQKDVQRLESLENIEREYAEIHKPAAENSLRRLGIDPKDEEFSKFHKETFHLYMRRGESFAQAKLATGPQEAHALLSSQDDLGGFLVPEDFRAEVIRDLAGFTVIRSAGARVVPTSRNSLVFPTIKPASGTSNDSVYSSNIAGAWRNEGEQGTDGSAPATQNQPTFGQVRIPVHIWQPGAVVVTNEFLEDSAVPVDSILAELFAETKGLDEDYTFINGIGVDRPTGLLNSGIATVKTGDANLLKYGGVVDLFTSTPAQYRQSGSWLMNSKTFGAILKLESTAGFLLFPPNAMPGTLMGKTVHFSEFMPDVAPNATPIIFGAFRYYVIAERTDLRLQRLVERFAPNIGLLPTARIGGQVVRVNAFRVQKVEA
jgi:HK97 family phage major capsid protein